jgi:hypothetical protein
MGWSSCIVFLPTPGLWYLHVLYNNIDTFSSQDAGYQFNINGEKRSFAGSVAFMSGDNLASQEIGGFKVGSASSLKCRECMGNATDIITCKVKFVYLSYMVYMHCM